MHVVAIDWSGAQSAATQRKHIWMATAEDGELTALTGGWTRQQAVQALLSHGEAVSEFVVGLDFAFSYPAWFLHEHGLASAYELWRLVAVEGENWLKECKPPFWGRPGARRPNIPGHFRLTELDNAPAKSVFQIGGAGAVGTGSIRGMPFLRQLHDSGFSIWPFDPPGWPMVVEIYPRVLTGPVRKNRADERISYLQALDVDKVLLAPANVSADAFDAAVSALKMSEHQDQLSALSQASDPVVFLEGAIWAPGPRDRAAVTGAASAEPRPRPGGSRPAAQ